jgi:hypothetical protein
MVISFGISVGISCGEKTMKVTPRSTSCDSCPQSLPPVSIHIDGFMIRFMFTSLKRMFVYELGL